MAKVNAVTITLPHGHTLKADKLTDRTIRTVKPGDYIPSTLEVQGTLCDFYGVVTHVQGDVVHGVFGSYDMPFTASIPKGTRVDVYRPIR